MGDINPFPMVNIFLGILSDSTESMPSLQKELEAQWGPSKAISTIIPFSHSEYYKQEMGTPLFKYLLSFQNPINPEHVYTLKIFTQAIEQKHTQNGKRQLNLDPGYITPYQVVLLSTKNYAHRIPLQEGIYAELELLYAKGQFQSLPWTYPDFKSAAFQAFFKKIRYTNPT